MKCHTTGYDHNVVASNNGFDDVAASLGWVFGWYSRHQVHGLTLKQHYPGLS